MPSSPEVERLPCCRLPWGPCEKRLDHLDGIIAVTEEFKLASRGPTLVGQRPPYRPVLSLTHLYLVASGTSFSLIAQSR